jgi:phosphatidylinositol glycan class S
LEHNTSLASHYASQAITFAEKAFFDKTMVSLLYFPLEHIYAMYMPFFVPVAIPLFSAVFQELKVFMMNRKVKMD